MTKNDPAVTSHVNMMQGIISRMAGNSASCKQWCIALVSALLALSKTKGFEADLAECCKIPVLLFCFMDCFYLGLEHQMKNKLENFVLRLNKHENVEAVIFSTKTGLNNASGPCESLLGWMKHLLEQIAHTILAFFSLSIFPFYICLYLLIGYLG